MDVITDPNLIPTDLRVECYWNLHVGGFSVRSLEGDRKGRVIAHVPTVRLADATFTVQPAGRAKVLREKRKNVHAFVRGRWQQSLPDLVRWVVTYNPYKHDSFVDANTGAPVHAARLAVGETVDGKARLSVA